MDLRLVRYVVVVAEERHFGRAAERVHLTQSGLSQAIQRLERELGFDVFARSSRSVELTDAGRAFVADAIALLERADAIVEGARAIASGLAGSFTIGYTPSIRVTAAGALAEFARGHPGLSIEHRQEYTMRLIAAVESRALDAAIVHSDAVGSQLCSQPFAVAPLVALVGDEHPLADLGQASLADIAPHPIAIVDAPSLRFWRGYLIDLFDRNGLEAKFMEETDPVGGEVPMPSRGPVWLVTKELATHPDHEIEIVPQLTVSFDLVWRRDSASHALEAFREHVAQSAGAQEISVKSAGSRSQLRRAPAPARIGRG